MSLTHRSSRTASSTNYYELSGEGGLPVRILKTQIKIEKNRSYFRETVKIIGSGVGAVVGITVGGAVACAFITGLGEKRFHNIAGATVILTGITVGAGVGASVGNKVTTCAFNFIFGQE